MRLNTKEKGGHNFRSRGDPVYTHTHHTCLHAPPTSLPIILTPVTSPPGTKESAETSTKWACLLTHGVTWKIPLALSSTTLPAPHPRCNPEVWLLSLTTCTEIPPPGANNEGIKQDERCTPCWEGRVHRFTKQ